MLYFDVLVQNFCNMSIVMHLSEDDHVIGRNV